MIDFGRDICGNLALSGAREWLVTNGLGGYASGTIAGPLTRRYHGLLVAAAGATPPASRFLLVTKFDETATYGGREYTLFANRWQGSIVEPQGFQHIERFHLEGATPVWTFALAEAQLEKRIWMQPGANTTYIQYTVRRGNVPLALQLKAITNHRDHHGNTRADNVPLRVSAVPRGLRVSLDSAPPYFILSEHAQATPIGEWYRGYFLSVEASRGLEAVEDNYCAGRFEVTLQPGESVTFIASTEERTQLDGARALAERQAHEVRLIEHSGLAKSGQTVAVLETATVSATPDWIRHLVLAADQFIVKRALPQDPDGRTVIAGYPWFNDWGRDTMIALPGLTLATRRYNVAAKILRTFARFVDQGMLPNNFPDAGETPGYNTVDATLWYFEAIRAYHAATNDDSLVRDLFPVLKDIIEWHQRGTRYSIHVDLQDGLLYAGEAVVQLTWMDAKVDDWVVTPRIGKPVEINALWHNALGVMADFARRLGQPAEPYTALAERVRASFGRFWNAERNCYFDVIDGPDGNDAALRPNQLFAVSLPHSPLTEAQQRAVVDICARHLLTSHGLRTLPLDDSNYHGHYNGDRYTRDGAYHQGTVWSWLIGPFVSAHLRVYGDKAMARSFLEPFRHHLADHCVGSISEVFDADPPFTPHACFAQAWSVAEVLRVWREME